MPFSKLKTVDYGISRRNAADSFAGMGLINEKNQNHF